MNLWKKTPRYSNRRSRFGRKYEKFPWSQTDPPTYCKVVTFHHFCTKRTNLREKTPQCSPRSSCAARKYRKHPWPKIDPPTNCKKSASITFLFSGLIYGENTKIRLLADEKAGKDMERRWEARGRARWGTRRRKFPTRCWRGGGEPGRPPWRPSLLWLSCAFPGTKTMSWYCGMNVSRHSASTSVGNPWKRPENSEMLPKSARVCHAPPPPPLR